MPRTLDGGLWGVQALQRGPAYPVEVAPALYALAEEVDARMAERHP